jgi:hypothetical protein
MQGKILAVAYILLFATAAIEIPAYYNATMYQPDKAAQVLTYAYDANSLSVKASYFQQALVMLKDYNGNPCWPFPTPENNYTTIKTSLSQAVWNATRLSNLTLSNYAYQQASANFNDIATNLKIQISNADGCYWIQPYINTIGFIGLILVFVMWMPILFFGNKLDGALDSRRIRIKNEKRRVEHEKYHKEKGDVCPEKTGKGYCDFRWYS